MAETTQSLQEIMDIEGAVAAALVDWQSGMTLGTVGEENFDVEVAAAGNTEVVRSKLKIMDLLGLQGNIQDILITLDDQYHLIRIFRGSTLFLYLVLEDRGDLYMARYKLADVESRLEV